MSGRSSTWLPPFALAVVGSALALLSNSCSRAARLSVMEPAAVTALPSERHGHQVTWARADSNGVRDDGLFVPAGDSISVYRRVDVHRGITDSGEPARYHFRSMASELTIRGYQPREGSWRAWEGRVRARGDSLEFVQFLTPPRGLQLGAPGQTLRLSPSSVSRVDLIEEDPGRTVALLLLVTATIAGVTIAALLASTWGWTVFL